MLSTLISRRSWWASAAVVACFVSMTGPGAPAAGAAAAPACNYYYEWIGKVRFPLQPDPHATYTYVMPSSMAARDGVGFLVRGQFIKGVWTSWMTYAGRDAAPFSLAGFVDNPPANTNDTVAADAGSVNPFVPGAPMLGAPRNFTLLFTPDGYRGPVAPTLDGTTTADIAPANRKLYPSPKAGDFWVMANRNYQAFDLPGLNPGGSTKDTFPVVTAVDLATGSAVDCQDYNVVPDDVQRAPTDPPDALNYGKVPVRLALKNGSTFDLLGGLGRGSRSQFAPTNPPGLVQFTRAPVGPGADVATLPAADNCAGYLATRTSTRLISLVRIPHIANYTNTSGVTPLTMYPNPVVPERPWEATFVSFSLYGSSSGFYLPGDPHTASIAGPQFKVDTTGGSTVLVWPRTLSRRQQKRVFGYADEQGWAIVRGGTAGRQASANVLFRVKGAASDYEGQISNLPCFFDRADNAKKPWSAIPVKDGSPWVATSSNLGTSAPQGVTCSIPGARRRASRRSIRALTSGRCLTRLKAHIRATGGSYFAPPPDERASSGRR